MFDILLEVKTVQNVNIDGRSVPETKHGHVFSFTMTQAQVEFVKANRKEINFSETFRQYLDKIIQEHTPKQ